MTGPSDANVIVSQSPSTTRPLVISVHGIRTRGAWQKELTAELNRAGFDYSPLDYGFFHAIQLLWPPTRNRYVNWFRDRYTEIARVGNGAKPSVICHSFGTYVVARALERFPEIRLDRLIFCGSIVRPDFPWTHIVQDSKQVNEVLNDYGHLDVWARIVAWVVEDAGPSARQGFTDGAAGKVVQREHKEFRHSDYFYNLNYDKNWIPFLKGSPPLLLSDAQPQHRNWKFRTTATVSTVLRGNTFVMGKNPLPRRGRLCEVCGAEGIKGRYCRSCAVEASRGHMAQVALFGHMKPKSKKAKARISRTISDHAVANTWWDPSSLPSWLTTRYYDAKIQPQLRTQKVREIAQAMRVSTAYAAFVRSGKRRPHPRHWQVLAKLAGIQENVSN